ncbi:MAG: NAD-dependent epimerase/dehydratase family protein [Deltaproteobacteria bacterium]|nr:NAD-dependent epimerase/dehydratase family protein [Deltaproteobacteria bacterium]
MTSLVTGGAGFIGSHVVRDLLSRGDKVVVLDDLSGGFRENVPLAAIFVEGSILDNELVESLFKEHRFDYVYHLAAYAAEGLSHFIKRFNYNNNLIGSVNMINASVNHGVKCFVFTSSIAVYGANQLPMTEELTPQPEDSYGIAKYAVEQELKCSKEMFGLNYVIFRPHNVYGEFQNIGDKYRNVIGIFMNQIMSKQPLTIFGDGTQTRAFSYIREISGIISDAPRNTDAYGEVFNIGADTPYSVNELANEVCSVFGVEPKINYLEARNEVQHAYSSHEKIKRFFPTCPSFSLKEGLSAMAKWAIANGPRKSVEFREIEISKNMPPSWRLEA